MSATKKKGNKALKYGLIMQSLAPLFLLTLIKNFDCDIFKENISSYIQKHIILVIIITICVLWIIASIFLYFYFIMFSNYGFTEGYTIKNISKNNDKGLEFFLTLIVPIVMDDLKRIQNAIIFALIVVAILILLSKTNLYYSNPVLVIIGYSIIEFEFHSNNDYKDIMVGIIPPGTSLDENHSIKYKLITDNVLYVRENRRK